MSKILITSGCSFSVNNLRIPATWSTHLGNTLYQLDYHAHRNSARSSQGNGLISRSTMYNVISALETYKPEDILVGVMWSGASRHDYRCTDSKDLQFVQANINNGWIKNPNQFVKNAPDNWVMLTAAWADGSYGSVVKEAELYYRHFYDEIGSSIQSIEHILRLQLFLESKKIPYFFTNYSDQNIVRDYLKENIEIKYLYDQIDFSKYLPVSSEFRWCYDNSKFTHLWPENWRDQISLHPKPEMHKEFVDQVIMPWLQEKYAGLV